MPPKLLVVDDDADLRQSIRSALESVCDVLEAASGLEALEMIRTLRPRAVLLDISMPEMGGLAVLRAARELCPALAVIMLTGELDLEIAREALESGARSYVTKPFEIETLRAEVKRILEPAKKESGDQERPWRIAGE
jgi:DNA-binding response OmpR family regulator